MTAEPAPGRPDPTESAESDDPADRFVGRASATERDSNSSEEFFFWIRPDVRVNPFDIAEADQLEESHTYGLVTNIHHSTDAASHLSNVISNDFGNSVDEPNTPRQGTNVARASVLSNDQDIYMPVQSDALVAFADEDGIHRALGIDTMREKEEKLNRRLRIPAGLIQMSNGVSAVAYLDADYVLGPESAHVNVSGISGLATKTSYMTFLIQSTLQTLDADDIAVILLNVKFDDLLHIHERRDLEPGDKETWERLGLDARPFSADHLHYLLPRSKGHAGQPNSFTVPSIDYKRYAYDLEYTATRLDLLLSRVPDPADTLGSMVGEVMEAFGRTPRATQWQGVKGWKDLLYKEPLCEDGQAKALGQIRASSVGRFLRLMRTTVMKRQSGIFVDRRSNEETTIEKEISRLRGGHTYVIDIAKLRPNEQTLVFGDVLRTVYSLFAGGDSADEQQLPKKVIVFVDELNKYAPAHSRDLDAPILDQLLDISERGRSFGIVLFSAQQFLNAVHPRVADNSTTKVLGRSASTVLRDSAYGFLESDVRMHLTRLDKGTLVLTHPTYRQPVKIRFPLPAYELGKQRQ